MNVQQHDEICGARDERHAPLDSDTLMITQQEKPVFAEYAPFGGAAVQEKNNVDFVHNHIDGWLQTVMRIHARWNEQMLRVGHRRRCWTLEGHARAVQFAIVAKPIWAEAATGVFVC